MGDQQLIVVSGATGNQGGAVVRALLEEGGWRIRALTRDPDQPAGRALSALGVEVVRADNEDRHALTVAMEGAYGVFSVQNFWKVGYDREVYQGKVLADVAQAAGVKHFIYSSVGGAERNTRIPHFESKWEIELHLRQLELRSTVFRPVFFMDNLLGPAFREAILRGELAAGMPPEAKLQMISLRDLGGFVAAAFADPTNYLGVSLEIAGDDVSMLEAMEILGRELGHPIRYTQAPMEEVRRQSAEWADMLEWFIQYGYKADITRLRRIYPPLQTFGEWASQAGWREARLREAA